MSAAYSAKQVHSAASSLRIENRKSMVTKLDGTRRILLEWSDIPLRMALAATFIAHGYDKIFVKEVSNFAPFLQHLGVPMPEVMAWVVACTEFGGGILVALGLLTRLAALGHACVMLVAIHSVHLGNGFMMGAKGAGFEWQLALLCIALCLAFRGAGPLSLDHLLCRCCSCKTKNGPTG